MKAERLTHWYRFPGGYATTWRQWAIGMADALLPRWMRWISRKLPPF